MQSERQRKEGIKEVTSPLLRVNILYPLLVSKPIRASAQRRNVGGNRSPPWSHVVTLSQSEPQDKEDQFAPKEGSN